MAYYDTCIYCGSHLDPGEKCDCKKAVAARNGQAVAVDHKIRQENAAKTMAK